MDNAFDLSGRWLVLAKMKEPLDIRWSRCLPKGATVSSVCVTKETAGRYFVSLHFEDEVASKPEIETKVGGDRGLSSFTTLSTGEKILAPEFFREEEKKLAFWQRKMANKKKGSKNRRKARRKIARIHARIADRRNDFLHKLSTRRNRRPNDLPPLNFREVLSCQKTNRRQGFTPKIPLLGRYLSLTFP